MRRQIGTIFWRVRSECTEHAPKIEMLKSLPRLAMKQGTGGRKLRRGPTAETGKSGHGVASQES